LLYDTYVEMSIIMSSEYFYGKCPLCLWILRTLWKGFYWRIVIKGLWLSNVLFERVVTKGLCLWLSNVLFEGLSQRDYVYDYRIFSLKGCHKGIMFMIIENLIEGFSCGVVIKVLCLWLHYRMFSLKGCHKGIMFIIIENLIEGFYWRVVIKGLCFWLHYRMFSLKGLSERDYVYHYREPYGRLLLKASIEGLS